MPGELGQLITARRGKQKDAHVAEILGVDPSSISRWRRGAGWPTPEHYTRLAKWLDIPVSQLADMVARERAAVGIKKYDGERAARIEMLERLSRLEEMMITVVAELRALSDPGDEPPPSPPRRRPPKR